MLIFSYLDLATDAERKLEQYRTEAMLSRITNSALSSPLLKWQRLVAVFVLRLRLEWAGLRNDLTR